MRRESESPDSAGSLVLFDVDGTLTQSCDIDSSCFAAALRLEFGFRKVNTDWGYYRSATDAGVFGQVFMERTGRRPCARDLSRMKARFVALLRAQLAENPALCRQVRGASSVIEELRNSAAWRVGIASGAWKESAAVKLASAQLDVAGLPMGTANDAASRLGIVRSAVRRAEDFYAVEHFDRVVYIGDSVWDLHTARALAMPFVGIGEGDKATELRAAGAHRVIPCYEPTDDFFRAIEGA